MWWHYLVAIPAALLIANGVPHFTQGVAGKRFPTAFSGGPGTEDTPLRNVLWGGGNLIVGGWLLSLIASSLADPLLVIELIVVWLGFSALLATAFGNPERFKRK
jgi:hypothetical protein